MTTAERLIIYLIKLYNWIGHWYRKKTSGWFRLNNVIWTVTAVLYYQQEVKSSKMIRINWHRIEDNCDRQILFARTVHTDCKASFISEARTKIAGTIKAIKVSWEYLNLFLVHILQFLVFYRKLLCNFYYFCSHSIAFLLKLNHWYCCPQVIYTNEFDIWKRKSGSVKTITGKLNCLL